MIDTLFVNSKYDLSSAFPIPIVYGIWCMSPNNRDLGMDIWGLCCQKQVSQAGISNYIPQFTVGCNYLSLPEIPASGNKVLICALIPCGLVVTQFSFSNISCWMTLYCAMFRQSLVALLGNTWKVSSVFRDSTLLAHSPLVRAWSSSKAQGHQYPQYWLSD